MKIKNEKINYHRYDYSNTYVINYSLYKLYGNKAIFSLDESFLDHEQIYVKENKKSEYDTQKDLLEENINDSNSSQLILKLQYDGNINEEY